MPPEPKKPVEEMLEASAKARREALGPDPQMPNPMRARLHDEIEKIARQEEEPGSRFSWLQMFWPRLAVAAVVATLLVMLPVMWSHRSYSTRGVAMQSAQNIGERRTSNVERRTPNAETDTAVSADELLSKGPAVATAATPEVNLAGNSKVELTPDQTPATSADTVEESRRLADAPTSGQVTKGYVSQMAPGTANETAAGAAAAKPAQPAAAPPAVASTEGAVRAKAASAARSAPGKSGTQQFAQRLVSQAFRNNNNSQANRATNVLNNFQVQQEGSAIRIVDSDGSTYTGNLEVVPTTANRAVARDKEDLQSRTQSQSNAMTQQSRFRASGYNLSLKRSLVFEGDYVAYAAQADQAKAQKRADAKDQDQTTQAARIVGTATVTGEAPVEVDAIATPESNSGKQN